MGVNSTSPVLRTCSLHLTTVISPGGKGARGQRLREIQNQYERQKHAEASMDKSVREREKKTYTEEKQRARVGKGMQNRDRKRNISQRGGGSTAKPMKNRWTCPLRENWSFKLWQGIYQNVERQRSNIISKKKKKEKHTLFVLVRHDPIPGTSLPNYKLLFFFLIDLKQQKGHNTFSTGRLFETLSYQPLGQRQ